MLIQFYFSSTTHTQNVKTELQMKLVQRYVHFKKHLPKNTVANMVPEYFIRHHFHSYT